MGRTSNDLYGASRRAEGIVNSVYNKIILIGDIEDFTLNYIYNNGKPTLHRGHVNLLNGCE